MANQGFSVARHYLTNMPENCIIKIDFTDAFDSTCRHLVLADAAESVPDNFHFCYLAYHRTSILQYSPHTIESQDGVQQGDQLGHLLFRLAVHPLLLTLANDLSSKWLCWSTQYLSWLHHP
jgi:hypothetical protein